MVKVLLIVHDSRNLLLGTSVGLDDNSDINDNGSKRYSDRFVLGMREKVDARLHDEMADLQDDASARVIHRPKRQFVWLQDDITEKYPILSARAQAVLLPFPTAFYFLSCYIQPKTDESYIQTPLI